MKRGFSTKERLPFPPKRGDIWMADLGPAYRSTGKSPEPPGRHPALVVSDVIVNQKGLAIVVFISSADHNPDGSVALSIERSPAVNGFINPFQVYALDWEARFSAHLGTCPSEEYNEVVKRLIFLIAHDQQVCASAQQTTISYR